MLNLMNGGKIMGDKNEVVKNLDFLGVDASFIIQEMFLGYKYRKHNGSLYSNDADVPTKLIKLYYTLKPTGVSFDEMKKAFVRRYVLNESKLENVHGEEEMAGFEKMYEYIHSDDINYRFDVYTLKDLHRLLFSCVPDASFGGDFRNSPAWIPGSRAELADWTEIRYRLDMLDKDVQFLLEMGELVKDSGDVDLMLQYLDECVELNAKLIKVHPFADGNGRTIRGFTNKLLENVGFPPIYVKASEKEEYRAAMNKAINEEDYADLKGFYRYKICDSIIELDINDTVRKYNRNRKDIFDVTSSTALSIPDSGAKVMQKRREETKKNN